MTTPAAPKFEFLSAEGRRAVVAAQRLARSREHDAVELEHVLSALLDVAETESVLRAAGADPAALRSRLERTLGGLPRAPGSDVYLGERVLRLLDIAQVEAQERGNGPVTPTHLLLAIPLETRSAAAGALRDLGVTLPALDAVVAKRPAVAGVRGDPAARPLLAKLTRDLTALAEEGRLDPVIGRHDEIRRVMQILGRRTKNNPILVGDPGVGKTSIAYGLAARIAAGDVPASLAGKRVCAFDVGGLVAGAKARGELEERVRGVLTELREAAGEVLLFFDEIHALVNAGKGDGSIDVASLLKPALARGELTCIGATTLEAYRLHIEKDAAFERRFQPILVEEPNDDECLAMLRGVKPKYEERHRVRVLDGTLVAAVKLSRRYVADRSLPDKAIDLLDEASSRLRLELDSHPDELDELERSGRALRVEIEAVARESTPDADERRRGLEARLAKVTERLAPLRDKWQQELAAITALGDATTAVEKARADAAAEERAGDLAKAAEMRFGRVPQLEAQLADATAKLRVVQGDERLLEDAVEPTHVARVVADWTGIPVDRMLEGERKKILSIEDRLRARVVGQDEAVRLVGHAVKRSRAGLADAGRPIGSFLFLGPTGVGKTELTKALAEFLFDDEHALVRLDMSEYMEKHAAARLVGAPPGYVGYEEGGQLTEAVRRRAYSVVLFDEVEKAHPDVFNVLLALLDDGRLTDSRGRTVSFANTVLIMTSNLGSHAILGAVESGDKAAMQAEVKAALRGHFRPELLNRIDETIIFNPLGREQIETIVGMQLRRLDAVLAEQKLALDVTPAARALLAVESYDPAFGARPVKRALQRRVRDPLAEAILEGRFSPGDVVRVDVQGEGAARTLVFEKTAAAQRAADPAKRP